MALNNLRGLICQDYNQPTYHHVIEYTMKYIMKYMLYSTSSYL